MAPLSPRPSTRLLRAAAAERAELERHRARALQERDSLRGKLERIEGVLAEIEDRRRLLERLAPSAPSAAKQTPDLAAPQANPYRELRGPVIRETAVRLLADQVDTDAMHYRQWFELLISAGYRVAGKDPLAVFLTQVSRSPAIRKATQPGVYELDRGSQRRLAVQLERLQREMQEVTSTSAAHSDLTAIRARRSQLASEISQVEKALEEAERVLSHKASETPASLIAATAE
jgi:chaperonin cofactor prefoldin